jgi:hypothetical protein
MIKKRVQVKIANAGTISDTIIELQRQSAAVVK